MENCFCCYFRQLFNISLAFKKCKRDCNILKIILVQGFCPLKTELLDFLSDLVLILVLVEFVTSLYEMLVLKRAHSNLFLGPKKRLLY